MTREGQAQHQANQPQPDHPEHTGVGSETALKALIRRRRFSAGLEPQEGAGEPFPPPAGGADPPEGDASRMV